MKAILLFVFVCNVWVYLPATAQFSYRNEEQNIQTQILNLTYPDDKPIVGNPINGIRNWLEAYRDFVYQLTNNNDKTQEELHKSFDIQIQQIARLNDTSPYYHYCLSDIYLMKSYLYFIEGDYLHLVASFYKAQKHYHINFNRFPEFLPNNKHKLIDQAAIRWLSVNVLGSFAETDSYPELQNIKNKYIQGEFFGSEKIVVRECNLLGLLFEASLENLTCLPNEQELQNMLVYAKSGPIETFAISMLFKKWGYYQHQLKILQPSDSMKYLQRMNILNLYYGIALQNQLDSNCENYVTTFIKTQWQNKYIAYAELKLACHYFLKGDSLTMAGCIEKIRTNTDLQTSEDRQAFYEVSHATDWSPEILKSRMLFDGGKYSLSAKILIDAKNRLTYFNPNQKLEYAYRLGRAYDKMGEFNHAITFYQMVINSGKESEFYFPAYASYYLAEIYLKKNETALAKKYLNVCLRMDSPIYKQTIHQKANDQLNRL